MSPLAQIEQVDFAASEFDGPALGKIPPAGLARVQNALVDDDGLLYKRGCTVAQSNAQTGAVALRFLWAGYLQPGERIVYADTADFGVLASNTTPTNLGLAGLTSVKRAASISGCLFIGGGWLYAGSLKTAVYNTGTVDVTQYSKTITGAGTSWTANVDRGSLIRVAGAGRYYVVDSVDSNTQITLRDTYQGATAVAQAYTASPIVQLTTPYRISDFYVAVQDRLLSLEGNRVYISDHAVPDPSLPASGQGPHLFTATDYHELPEGIVITGGSDVGSLALIFTTRGVFTIGGLANDLTDDAGNVQQRVDHQHPDLILWENTGIASFGGQLVVPATDGCWLIDGISRPRLLTRSIAKKWRAYVEAGYRLGQAATYRGHYLVPIHDSSYVFQEMLVCRLDRPTNTDLGEVFPWSSFDGLGADVTALAGRHSSPTADPSLLGAENRANPRIARLDYFEPAASVYIDRGSVAPLFDVVTRDLRVGRTKGQTKKIEAEYEMDIASGGQAPFLAAAVQTGEGGSQVVGADWGISDWGSGDWATDALIAFTALEGTAPEDPEGDDPFTWPVNVYARYVRFRFFSEYQTAKLVLKGFRLFVRPNRKD